MRSFQTRSDRIIENNVFSYNLSNQIDIIISIKIILPDEEKEKAISTTKINPVVIL